MKRFYITTAIDYANGSPHLGHAYEKVLTDVIARHRRLLGEDVHFLTGLDEHGQKVQQTAEARGVEPLAFCDGVAGQFRDLCARLDITNDDFIRTTEGRHKAVVQTILQDLYDRGEIYLAEYQGFYSVRAEQFVQEKDKVDGEWPEIFGEVNEISEQNYFFRLAQHQDWLVDHIRSNESFIFPRFRANQVLEFLKEPVNDLCISRPLERLSWGIPLPFDPAYVTYVWFDALVNYISAIGYGTDRFGDLWPVDFHVIGKDILVPPHAVYWPIMLKAIGVELPRSILTHGWWLSRGKKESKTDREKAIAEGKKTKDALDLIRQFGPDPFRYFVTREMNVGQDSDFTEELFMERYNSDLANNLGNLLNRVHNMCGRYCEGRVPAADEDPGADAETGAEAELRSAAEALCTEVRELFVGLQFHRALERTVGFVSAINAYLANLAPWKLAKSDDPADQAAMRTSLATAAEGLRIAAACFNPVMPNVSEKIYRLLGLAPLERWADELEWGGRLEGNALGEKTILFPKP